MISQRKVLVIDDTPEDQELYRRYLQYDPDYLYTIVEATSGRQGLALWQHHQPDIILLDYRLPDLDGLEFLTQLRNLTQQTVLPVILVTGQGNEVIAAQAIKIGAQDYLVKEQMTPERLQRAIQAALTTLQLQAQLQQHIDQERFIVDITRKIHRSLNLDEILQILVTEVRQFLQTDRVFIVRAQPDQTGTMIAESVGAEWRSLLSDADAAEDGKADRAYLLQFWMQQGMQQGQFASPLDAIGLGEHYVESYGQAWNTTAFTPNGERCDSFPVHLLDQLQVKANLMVPILYEDQFWGLLIVQHCAADRLWQPTEVDLLQQLTSQMSIAIRQAELYQQAQHELAERQQVERALRRANRRFELAAAAVNCLIYEWDVQTNLVERSQGLIQLLGYTPEEAGNTAAWWSEHVHPDDFQAIHADFIANLVKLDRYCSEYRVRHRDGHYIWVEDQSMIVRNQMGQVIKVVGSTRDITDRKQSEAELQASRAQLQQQLAEIEAIYRTAPIGLNVLDPDLRFIRINQRLADINGYSVEDHIGRTVQDLLPDLADAATAILRPILETGEPRLNVEIQGETPAQPGVMRTWLEHFLPLKNGDRVIGISTVCEEITERKQAEAEREQLLLREKMARAEAERANRIKDEFLAILSHELRSPLNPILGWSKLLQTRQFDPDKTTEALAAIERNAKLLTQLIDDLLDVAKILRGKMSLNAAPVNLASVIEAAIDTVKTAAIAKSIQLHAVLPNIGQVTGDATRLQQIVWNILSNAIKFTPPQGQVNISLEQVEGQAQITVKDTGKGISPGFRPYLFESFQQEDISTTRKYGGLGLGLAIVRHLVEAHGGTITADSPGEGQGATFTVRLPLLNTQQAIDVASGPIETEPVLTDLRVLTVDDDEDGRELLKVLLTQYGAEVMAVSDAAEALAALAAFQPHVLMSDIGMPEVDGYTLLQQIRARSAVAGGQIPAIALTAYTSEADQQRALEAGFQLHLAKPLDPQQVIQAIMMLLAERSG